MTAFTTSLLELLAAYGPGLLFLMAIGETSFVTGLVVTSGVATSVGTVLAGQGVMSYQVVALAAFSGGFIGDSIGYGIGRRWGERLLPTKGRFGAAVRRAYAAAAPFFGRHPVYSVTVGRLVAFVRTVMPLGAGTSGMPYLTFVRYEVVGLAGWVAMYMAIGYLAGESWEIAASVVGAGWTLVFVAVGVVMVFAHRRRRRGSRGAAREGRSDVTLDRAPAADQEP